MQTEQNLPLVSIIIPTFNRVVFLQYALKSVVVVDDASTDHTQDFLINNINEKMTYIRHEKNQGGAVSRNTGIANAKGKYIAFLDDDDEWLPENIELHLEVFKTNPNAGVVYSGFFVRDMSRGKIIGAVVPNKRGNIYKSLLLDNCVGTSSVVMARRDILLRAGFFDSKLPSCQDWDLWLTLARLCEFDYVKKPTVIYSLHDKRISTDPYACLKGRQIIFDKYKSDINSDKSALAKHYLRIGNAYILAGDKERGRKYITNAIKSYPINIEGYAAYISSFFNAEQHTYMTHLYRRLRYRMGGRGCLDSS